MTAATNRHLHRKADQAWRFAWRHLYHERTGLFYDFVSSYDAKTRFAHLPTIEEIARQYPNTNGWGTGMEDSSISAGVMMSLICDRHEATGDASLRAPAARVFAGMVLCGTLSPARGLVLRSVSPFDGKSHYIETSRDQYTHYAHGLWRFYHSPLSDDTQRATMRELISAVCERLEQRITAKYRYCICMENDEPGIVDKMWHVAPHEAARLPMIYRIGYDLTGDSHWLKLYRRYALPAAKQSLQVPLEMRTPYAFLQEQVSLEPLCRMETDRRLKALWQDCMRFVAGRVEAFPWQCLAYHPVDITTLDLNWRHWDLRDCWGRYFAVWPETVRHEDTTMREPAEALLVQLMCPGRPLAADQRALLERTIAQVDYGAAITYAAWYPLAAYWRAVAKGVIG